jgi:hypothetical protein
MTQIGPLGLSLSLSLSHTHTHTLVGGCSIKVLEVWGSIPTVQV